MLIIRNVYLAHDDHKMNKQLFDVTCEAGHVESVVPAASGSTVNDSPSHIEQIDGQGRSILLPALCHAHIHLDKCFILDQCEELITGDFAEALRVTAKVKKTFSTNLQSLYDRGKRMIIDSVKCGVTAMRAHVEVDETVGMSCIEIGLKLRSEFQEVCDVQIAVFAQDPIFAGEASEETKSLLLLKNAAQRTGISIIGSAPYVEANVAYAKRNISVVLDMAYQNGLHVDFHLDYNLDPTSEPLLWFVLDELRARIASDLWQPKACVCVGHDTRATLFSSEEWKRFCHIVEEDKLPITLVGLPPSDIYMMGRNQDQTPRGTLDVPRLAREHGLKLAMSVNNVENAFTPQGPVDPLALCTMGVALFQSGTKQDCRSLIEAVTINARAAIGISTPENPVPIAGDKADFVLLRGNSSVYAAALNPVYSRTTIRNGVVVAERQVSEWVREST
ncbi:Metallo-dependent hydrolase [Laetiporus sulphureus 93-53]|uniref:Metallo-dependent hydrolase n=1 Tax=Laetiporus sulphureus 93-53 TaxID=1314785 RepID=A0A165HR44_9APHY|nr:Metallo-dependent hydrolase [Laetiporus sulphureus 93-53]KZT12071.1 Metallo-dependent hydrolase [Laetiporus sulphureus 93-53]